jgi:peptidoglycan/xylan/chitin deacetylase (PgdA/CDA1 family)
MNHVRTQNRRSLLKTALGSLAAAPVLGMLDGRGTEIPADGDQALIAITLDLEMSRHYPTWEQTHWDYEKGNLDTDTKRYAVEAARRVKAHGGVLHFFAVGRVLEQENLDWLAEIHREGHPIGNHTYDHVNVKATTPEQIQFRFQRAPWLIEGKRPADVIADNIRLTSRALKQRLNITANGFRTPGGFNDGLHDRPDVQKLLLGLGFNWVSSLYPPHPHNMPGQEPTAAIIDGIVKAQPQAQPFVYPTGLIEVPMNPISDVSAMRAGRWKLEPFLDAVRRGVEWAIEHRAVYDFLAHPSCLVVADPELKAIELICSLVRQAGQAAAIVDLGKIAERARKRSALN